MGPGAVTQFALPQNPVIEYLSCKKHTSKERTRVSYGGPFYFTLGFPQHIRLSQVIFMVILSNLIKGQLLFQNKIKIAEGLSVS